MNMKVGEVKVLVQWYPRLTLRITWKSKTKYMNQKTVLGLTADLLNQNSA